jgi:glycosyltransferase involved in cell wall biosynthesis
MICGASDTAQTGLAPSPTAGSTVRRSTAAVRGIVDGIDVIALPVPYSNRDGLARRALVFTRFALRALAAALREPCDLVFATSTPLTAAIPGVAAKWFRRKPFVFEVRDLWPELPRAMGLKNPFLLGVMSLLEWLGYHAADGVVGLSPGIVEGIRKRAPRKTPVVMVPNGCDLELFKPAEMPATTALAATTLPVATSTPTSTSTATTPLSAVFPGIQPGDFVAGFTGAHGPANGLDAVLDAAAALKRRGPNRIKLLFVGDGKSKAALVERARREGLDNCVFAGPVAKTALAGITAALDCGLMVLKDVPAFYRGTSPNKFFDYIAAGVPVLNNYPGWLAGMVADNACGVVVAPGDADAFADALLQLAAAPDGNAAMRRASRALAEREFSREKLASEFCGFLETLTTAA